MKHFAGLEVSLREVSICVVDEDGKTMRGVWHLQTLQGLQVG